MARDRGFRVLVATDGSRQGRAAVAMAAAFPWPRHARASGMVARGEMPRDGMPASLGAVLDRGLAAVAASARRALDARWPGAQVSVVDGPAAEAIVARARGPRPGAIVLGSRGHGRLGRLLLGSVSRAVVRRSRLPVLVVKGRARPVRQVVIGIDGSPGARRAVALAARLVPPRGGQAVVVRVLEPIRLPSVALLPASLRAAIGGEASALRAQLARKARAELQAAASRLRRGGWKARSVLCMGVPAIELLRAARTAGADVLVVGARGVSGIERLVLGSVAETVLTAARVPVLIVR